MFYFTEGIEFLLVDFQLSTREALDVFELKFSTALKIEKYVVNKN